MKEANQMKEKTYWKKRNKDITTKLKTIDNANLRNNTLDAQKFYVTEGSIKYWRWQEEEVRKLSSPLLEQLNL